MLIYARVGLILTRTPPASGYLFPSRAIFHPCSSTEQILRFSIIHGRSSDQIRRILQTSDARSRNSAPRDYVAPRRKSSVSRSFRLSGAFLHKRGQRVRIVEFSSFNDGHSSEKHQTCIFVDTNYGTVKKILMNKFVEVICSSLREKLYIFSFVYPWPGDCCYEKNRIQWKKFKGAYYCDLEYKFWFGSQGLETKEL